MFFLLKLTANSTRPSHERTVPRSSDRQHNTKPQNLATSSNDCPKDCNRGELERPFGLGLSSSDGGAAPRGLRLLWLPTRDQGTEGDRVWR